MGVTLTWDWLSSKFVMMMWPLKAETFSRIFCWRPMPVETEMIIMIIPIAIAAIAILIIGVDIVLLRFLAVISLLAMKYSRFTDVLFRVKVIRFLLCR